MVWGLGVAFGSSVCVLCSVLVVIDFCLIGASMASASGRRALCRRLAKWIFGIRLGGVRRPADVAWPGQQHMHTSQAERQTCESQAPTQELFRMHS